MEIPLCIPFIEKEEINSVTKVLASGWLAHGPAVKEFEKKFAEYNNVKHAVSVNSCASALFLSIKALGVKGEIILPSFTFVASANAVLTTECKPVFADIEHDSCNVDPESIKKLVNKNTVAIMPVHFAGQSCRMDEIMEIAEENNLFVIEDSAEAIGAEYKGKKTGSFGIGCFSFYPTKNMTTGEGGMITTNDSELADKMKAIRAHGIQSSAFEREKEKKSWYREASYAGYNFRMPDILAAIGVEQLKKLDEMNKMRRKNAEYLNKGLEKINWIETPVEEKDCKHVYQMYTLKVKEEEKRNKLVNYLREQGIMASVHFDPPVHSQKLYKGFVTDEQKLDVTEDVVKKIVSLPMYPKMNTKELDYIIEKVSTFNSKGD